MYNVQALIASFEKFPQNFFADLMPATSFIKWVYYINSYRNYCLKHRFKTISFQNNKSKKN